MFESYRGDTRNDCGDSFKCIELAEKLMHLFSWRQKYNVEKLQRSLTIQDTDRFNRLMQKWQEGIQSRVERGVVGAETTGGRPDGPERPGGGKTELRRCLSTDGTYVRSAEDLRSSPKNENRKSCLSLNSSHLSADSWVAVQSLQTSDGGILDPDDRLNDVVDDREQIIANFSDGDGRHNGGGDGASGSSVGTESPDIFQGEGKYYSQAISGTDIEVTGDQPIVNVLQVRRGSEPALNQIEGPNGAPASSAEDVVNSQANKRWSAAPIILDVDSSESDHRKDKIKQNGYAHPSQWPSVEEEDRYLGTSNLKFQRDGSNRLSMQFTDETGYKWLERANHVRGGSNRSSYSSSLQRDNRRREPLGQANSSNTLPSKSSDYVIEEGNLENLNTEFIVLRNEGGPLGIHVVPDYDSEGRDRGLLVQGIEPGGRVYRDGRLAVSDTIIEINGCNLLNEPFQKVQEIFKNSLSAGELRLKIVKHNSSNGGMYNKPMAAMNSAETNGYEGISNSNMVEGSQRMINCSAKVATVSPTKKLPAGAAAANILQSANTRKMGRRIDLELLKGPNGLGFSITTRDNPAGGNCPIYIKNILPKGAAVDDGRLRPGDRLLQVNDIEMTGKTQPEAVAILRQAPPGSIVKISVSRQDENHIKEEPIEEKEVPVQPVAERNKDDAKTTDSNSEYESASLGKSFPSSPTNTSHKVQKPPRSLDDSQIFPWRHREILTFDIPVHDTEKAGLGVSVKGKTSANHSSGSLNGSAQTVDLGIFVKSVINGGAASRDGRLRTNDQLLSVNGKSLLYQSNANAMETLRRAMLYVKGPKPGVISLTIARRVTNPGSRGSSSSLLTSSSGPDLCRSDSEGVTPDHSVGSEASDSTVIFLPQENNSYKSDGMNDSHVSSPGGQRSHEYSSGSRNPVIDRLTGHISNVNNNALRNESYYRATHESTWNTSNMVNTVRGGKMSSPTINPVVAEPVLIEEDYHFGDLPNYRESSRRPSHDSHTNPPAQQHYDGNIVNGGPAQTSYNQGDITYASQLSLDENAAGFSRDAFGRQSMSEKRHATLDAKNTDTYRRNKKLREERQQVAAPDQGKQNRISQKIAEIRQELLETNRAPIRFASAESLVFNMADYHPLDNELKGRKDIGPALGMKKSSSLESLQTMVQEIQMAEDPDPAYTYRNSQGAVRVIRGRGCNDSFRAAVDRSYDAPLGLRNQMETPVSEEEMMQGTNDLGGNLLGRGTPRQSSMNAIRDPKLKQSKKKSGLLKGIGSMFRFGKHRKGMDPNFHGGFFEEEASPPTDEAKPSDDSAERQREEARIAAEEEHEKIQEQYRKLIQRQQENKKHDGNSVVVVNGNQGDRSKYAHIDGGNNTNEDENSNPQSWRRNESNYSGDGHHSAHDVRETDNHRNRELESRIRNRSYDMSREKESEKFRKFSLDSSSLLDERERSDEQREKQREDDSPQSRSERMHKLRVKHQKKHLERRGQYPSDEREEKYEQTVRQPSLSIADPKTHVRSGSYDYYGDLGRPGSRTGISDPGKYSHYVNYEEIQQHLNRKKQHYHSQRRERDFMHHQRPVSNFYEYESIQSSHRSATNPGRRPSSGIAPTIVTSSTTTTTITNTVTSSMSSSTKPIWQGIPRFDVETTKINASSLPRRIDIEELHSSPSVKSTVNYLNKLSSLHNNNNNNNNNNVTSGSHHHHHHGVQHDRRMSREGVSNLRAKGPFISQITIKENPNES